MSLVGQTVSHYHIVAQIGAGAMGLVFKAEDTRLKRMVALKFLSPTLREDADARERFVEEAKAASALDHPNVCTVFEIEADEEGRDFIAMAFYEGDTLAKRIRVGTVTSAQALDYTRQVLSGLAKAHTFGIVHRDIKPGNIIVTNDDVVKILDFGVAMIGPGTVTSKGSVLGTYPYMSPELVRRDTVDQRTDLWSAGVMLYEMLTGSNPFHASYPQAAIYSILNVEPKNIEETAAIAPGLDTILTRALCKSPEERYQSAGEFANAIDAVLETIRRKAEDEARLVRQGIATVSLSDLEPAVADSELSPMDRVRFPVVPEPLHLLIVDDEPELELLVRSKFRARIRAHEWIFHFALDGRAALQQLSDHAEIALVLTDINMPGMDGLTLVSEIDRIDRPIRAVVVSAYGDMRNIRTAMNRGAFDFVTKPIDFEDLETTILKTEQDLAKLRIAHDARRAVLDFNRELETVQTVLDASTVDKGGAISGFAEASGYLVYEGELGGGFYDHFRVDETRVGFLLGWISGTPVSSALLAFASRYLLRSTLRHQSPEESISSLGTALDSAIETGMEVRAICGLLDRGGDVSYCSLGACQALVLGATGLTDSLNQPNAYSERVDGAAGRQTTLESGDGLILRVPGSVAGHSMIESGAAYSGMISLLAGLSGNDPREVIRLLVRDASSANRTREQSQVGFLALRLDRQDTLS